MSGRTCIALDRLRVYTAGGRSIIDVGPLYVDEGEAVCVLGPTGSGKTTFLKALTGLIPTLYKGFRVSGNVLVYGYRPEEALARGLTAYVPQDVYSFFVGSTPREELVLATKSGEIVPDVGRYLDFDMDTDISALSDGQVYRLLLFSAIATGARVIAIDEPSSHIDWYSVEDVMKFVRSFAEDNGVAVLLSDHRVDIVKKFCSKVLLLGDVDDTCPLPEVVDRAGSDILVSLERVSLSYGYREILKDVSLSISSGEAMAIVGRNGVGKTSLIKIIAGMAKPTSGSVLYGRRSRVFVVPQNPVYWYPNTSVDSLIRLFAENTNGLVRAADMVLREIGVNEPRGLNVYMLSVGGARAFSLVLAYASGADLVLIDEAALGLDCRLRRLALDIINILTAKGAAVVVTTHDMAFASSFPRVYTIDGGSLRRIK